jgi:hypothetical protein
VSDGGCWVRPGVRGGGGGAASVWWGGGGGGGGGFFKGFLARRGRGGIETEVGVPGGRAWEYQI